MAPDDELLAAIDPHLLPRPGSKPVS